ncbi:ybaK/ebsC family protein [Gottschalkia acidurici 9a]|uniref:Cys-tRNA(Pro)/Cys-tRNA(Cys) deacylase n=1 Tax=Gottschalkia acidurici (strain ATCC 7906 / DSM 604 / BCRC 14475 / CIP 104303 / KCTC 5404 / NCIMB 10678 / 9a) TaxID=1128398 RepID=K0B547_GOTA9|nr:ybaK/ebsC family protein [Gottschalkia acidurici 9a]
MMAQVKTNAMRILDSKKIDYKVITYDNKDGKIDGVSVAEKIGKSVESVYKTLVAQGTSKEIYVFIIPVIEELDLKKASKVTGKKKIEMIAVNDITKHTGYIRGGCSPVGMKKLYKTFINNSAESLETIVVSGGKIGIQIELLPNDLLKAIDGKFGDIIK